jgi:hypothetical protein
MATHPFECIIICHTPECCHSAQSSPQAMTTADHPKKEDRRQRDSYIFLSAALATCLLRFKVPFADWNAIVAVAGLTEAWAEWTWAANL